VQRITHRFSGLHTAPVNTCRWSSTHGAFHSHLHYCRLLCTCSLGSCVLCVCGACVCCVVSCCGSQASS
jgi:hypothetical protein